MSHDHNHSHATKNITVAFFLNLGFAVIELFGGLFTNSVAILSDALHDFGDSISLGVAWYLQRLSDRKRDRFYSYGYKRFSLLGAVFISLVLLVGSCFIIKESVGRILSPELPDAEGMFWLSILGIAVNGFAALRLKRGTSLSERAVSLHLLEDVLGWIAVLVVSVVMMFVQLPILDPLLSIGISVWVLMNVFKNLRATFGILMQEVPRNVDLPSLEAKVLNLPDVCSLHDVHLWTLDGENHILTLHVVTCREITVSGLQEIKMNIRRLCDQYNIHHATIEFETECETCALNDEENT